MTLRKILLLQEGIITEIYESPDKSYLEQPQELSNLVDSTKLIHKYLPKQVDIDKIMDIIKRKVLKGTHLPLTINEIEAGYLSSSIFKDLYVYLAHNKLPSKKNAIRKVLTLTKLCLARSVAVQTDHDTGQRESLVSNS